MMRVLSAFIALISIISQCANAQQQQPEIRAQLMTAGADVPDAPAFVPLTMDGASTLSAAIVRARTKDAQGERNALASFEFSYYFFHMKFPFCADCP